MNLRDVLTGMLIASSMSACLYYFDNNARTDEREIVTVEKEKVIHDVRTIVIQKTEEVKQKTEEVKQKQKEINHVAKQRDQALAEVARLKSDADTALGRLREQLESVNAAAKAASGDSEAQRRIIEAQGKLFGQCAARLDDLGRRAEKLAEENRSLRQQWPSLDKLK